MYKLTSYGTDDDLDENNDGGDLSKKPEKVSISYDKSDSLYSKPWAHRSAADRARGTNMVEKDGREYNSIAATSHGRKIVKQEGKHEKKKAHPLITSHHSPNKTPKSFIARCCKGCPTFLLLVYLVLLTAAVMALFFLVQQLKDENHALKQFYVKTSRGVQGNAEQRSRSQTFLKDHQGSLNPNSISCCDYVRKNFRDFRSKLAQTSDQVGKLQKLYEEKFDYNEKQLSELETALNLFRNRIRGMKSINEDFQQPVDYGNTENPLPQQYTNQTVAFRFIRAAEGTTFNFNAPSGSGDNQSAEGQKPLQFVEEESFSGSRDALEPISGTFTAPAEGVYIFFVSFCTYNANIGVELALMRNEELIRSFKAPFLSDNSSGFVLTSFAQSFPITPSERSDSNNGENVTRHSYSVITKLGKNDEVKLQIMDGVIVELASRNGTEQRFCTEFAGYKI